MIVDELTYRIRTSMGLEPTDEQVQVIAAFCRFMTAPKNRPVFLLRGSAGTGKTTLAAAIVRGLQSLGQKLVLLAPTGRAAKVFSLYSGTPAYTIHRRIYRQRTSADIMSAFQLNYNTSQDTLFIVDEASMINNGSSLSDGYGNSEFGSGSLLDDLIEYVYGNSNNRLMLIGDRAQLPPVGQTESPALLADVLQSYFLQVYEADLNHVLRQSEESGILWNATRIRKGIGVRIRFKDFPDIHLVRGEELIDQLGSSYSRVGKDETIVITRSNKRAIIYNRGIRNMVLCMEEELCSGDMLMIVKNNYSLTPSPSPREGSAPRGDGGGAPDFIANGDRAVVRRIRHEQQLYGFRFAEVTMTFPDYDDYELTATVLLDTLMSEAPALTREQQTQLFEGVMADYQDIPYKSERMKKLKEDRFYNALQVKYAYAVTCHKAQGGQWAHVYVDQGYMTDDMLTPEYIHWLYTAFTRATEHLYLVNWPEKMVNDEDED
jgi:tRNA A37 threonylcarbamoyladenosine biosynthesis protein TsaE